jgi:hypothetical protein
VYDDNLGDQCINEWFLAYVLLRANGVYTARATA